MLSTFSCIFFCHSSSLIPGVLSPANSISAKKSNVSLKFARPICKGDNGCNLGSAHLVTSSFTQQSGSSVPSALLNICPFFTEPSLFNISFILSNTSISSSVNSLVLPLKSTAYFLPSAPVNGSNLVSIFAHSPAY